MARIRTIKPEFFDDPHLAELPPFARLLFIGLWTQADREGRLIDDPRRLKARLFPYDEQLEVEPLLVVLAEIDFIRRYRSADDKDYIWIRSFVKHQRPHPKEPESVIPKWSEAAAKKHGKPRKNISSQQSNGLWTMDYGRMDYGRKAAPAARTLREQDKNVKVIAKIAHEVIASNGHKTDADAVEAIKALCAKRHIAYDSEVVRKALDSAEVQST